MENTTFTQLLNEAFLEVSRQNPNGDQSDLLQRAQEMAYDRYDAYQESQFAQSEVYGTNWNDIQDDIMDMRWGKLQDGEY